MIYDGANLRLHVWLGGGERGRWEIGLAGLAGLAVETEEDVVG